jgi:cytoskeleton protein RodZ
VADQAPSSLGEFLRQEREKRGITIEQVASATKINVRLLHLLESDQYSELPAKPFIRGFVSAYSRFIGIDSKDILTHFGDFLEMRSQDRPKRDAGHSGYAFEKREGEQSRTILWIVMGVFVLFGGIGFVVLKPSLKKHRSSHLEKLREANPEPSEVAPSGTLALLASPLPSGSPTPSPSVSPSATVEVIASPTPTEVKASSTPTPVAVAPVVSSTTVVPSPSPTPSPEASASVAEEKPDPLNSGKNLKPEEVKYKVVFKAGADVWVRYQIDSRPKMKFILREGRVLVLKSKDSVRFQTSDPGSITFRLNGGQSRVMEGDGNAAVKGHDLTLFFPKELIDSTQEVFPGERPIQGVSVPVSRTASPTATPSE